MWKLMVAKSGTVTGITMVGSRVKPGVDTLNQSIVCCWNSPRLLREKAKVILPPPHVNIGPETVRGEKPNQIEVMFESLLPDG